jgi:hypothetical protein
MKTWGNPWFPHAPSASGGAWGISSCGSRRAKPGSAGNPQRVDVVDVLRPGATQ